MTDPVKPATLLELDLHPVTSEMLTQPGTKPVFVKNGAVMPPDRPLKDSSAADAMTTVPKDTFKQVPLSIGDGGLLYWPGQNAFLALYPEELREVCMIADEHTKKIEALQTANKKVTEASVQLRHAHLGGVKADVEKAEEALKAAISEMTLASEEVKKKLEPLSKLSAKDGVKMVELVGRKTKDYDKKGVPIYTSS